MGHGRTRSGKRTGRVNRKIHRQGTYDLVTVQDARALSKWRLGIYVSHISMYYIRFICVCIWLAEHQNNNNNAKMRRLEDMRH